MDKISQAAQILRDAKIILIGAGAGLSTAAAVNGRCAARNFEIPATSIRDNCFKRYACGGGLNLFRRTL